MPSPLTGTGDPTGLVVPSGAVTVKVIVPVGLKPPVTVAESLSTDVPTTPSAVLLAEVLTAGLALVGGKAASPLAVPYWNETFEIWLTSVNVLLLTVKWNTSAVCSYGLCMPVTPPFPPLT